MFDIAKFVNVRSVRNLEFSKSRWFGKLRTRSAKLRTDSAKIGRTRFSSLVRSFPRRYLFENLTSSILLNVFVIERLCDNNLLKSRLPKVNAKINRYIFIFNAEKYTVKRSVYFLVFYDIFVSQRSQLYK